MERIVLRVTPTKGLGELNKCLEEGYKIADYIGDPGSTIDYVLEKDTDEADNYIKNILDDIQSVIDIQGYDGNWNADEYMRGMYNGMIVIQSNITGQEPEFKEPIPVKELATSFETELTKLINKFSKENGSDTPDYILGTFLNNCLMNFNHTLKSRRRWHGEDEAQKVEDKSTREGSIDTLLKDCK